MSTQISSSELQNTEGAVCADFSNVTQLATGSATGSISIFARPSGSDQWTLASTIKAHNTTIRQVALAPSGNIIASTDGSDIRLWRLQAFETGESHWEQQAALTSEGGVAALRFTANADDTLWLAAAVDDGTIRIYHPSSSHIRCEWNLHSVVNYDCCINESNLQREGSSTSIAWKPSSYADVQLGVPAMFVVGHPSGGAGVWWYDIRYGRWRLGPRLSSGQSSEEVAAVAWAPPNGRPAHLIAIAHSSSVSIWHVSGPANSLQEEEVAHLKTSGRVWQMEFNSTGSWLAASVRGGNVQLFRSVLDGSWQLLSEVRGDQSKESSTSMDS